MLIFQKPSQTTAEISNKSLRKPKRLMMVTARFLPEMGGIETHVDQISRRLVAKGYEITVVTTDRTNTLPPFEERDGFKIVRAKAFPRKRDYYFAPEIYSIVKSASCDLIHIQGCHTLVPIIAMLSAIRHRKQFVVTFHSGGHSSPSRTKIRDIQWKIFAPLFRRAKHAIGVSQYESTYFKNRMRLPANRLSTIPNGAQMPITLQSKSSIEFPKIISIGRLERYKGHHKAILALRYVLNTLPNASLRVLGEGPYKSDLQNLSSKLGLESQVEIGGVDPSNRKLIANVIASADLVVLFSEYEAHPIAIMEALALGRSVLVSRNSGFIELIDQGLVGGAPSDATPEELAKAIIEEITQPRKAIPVKLPTWESCVEKLEKVYSSPSF